MPTGDWQPRGQHYPSTAPQQAQSSAPASCQVVPTVVPALEARSRSLRPYACIALAGALDLRSVLVGSMKVSDEKFDEMVQRVTPCTLPVQAYGPDPVVWFKDRPRVWAWVTWPHKPAERVAGVARGANGRVVVVSWDSATGTVECVVWRNAVTVRA